MQYVKMNKNIQPWCTNLHIAQVSDEWYNTFGGVSVGGKTTAKAKNEWIAKAYDRINLTVPKGHKKKIQQAAETRGESVNGFINRLISCALEQEQLGECETETHKVDWLYVSRAGCVRGNLLCLFWCFRGCYLGVTPTNSMKRWRSICFEFDIKYVWNCDYWMKFISINRNFSSSSLISRTRKTMVQSVINTERHGFFSLFMSRMFDVSFSGFPFGCYLGVTA